MEKKNIALLFGLVLVVAVVAGAVGAGITGNSIKIRDVFSRGYNVYTRGEIDNMFADVKMDIYASEFEALERLSACEPFQVDYSNIPQNSSITGIDICNNYSLFESSCVLAGEIYAQNGSKTGYSISACHRNVVFPQLKRSGWALCCATENF